MIIYLVTYNLTLLPERLPHLFFCQDKTFFGEMKGNEGNKSLEKLNNNSYCKNCLFSIESNQVNECKGEDKSKVPDPLKTKLVVVFILVLGSKTL